MGVVREELIQARTWEVREGPEYQVEGTEYQVEGTTRLKAVTELWGQGLCRKRNRTRSRCLECGRPRRAGVRDLTGLGHVGLIDSE